MKIPRLLILVFWIGDPEAMASLRVAPPPCIFMAIWDQFRGCVFTHAVSGILKCPHKTSCLILGTLELMRYYSLIMVCVKGNFANIIRITNELNVTQSQERIPSGPNVITRPSKAGLSPGGHRRQIRDIQSRRNECSITSFETRRGSVPEDRQH